MQVFYQKIAYSVTISQVGHPAWVSALCCGPSVLAVTARGLSIWTRSAQVRQWEGPGTLEANVVCNRLLACRSCWAADWSACVGSRVGGSGSQSTSVGARGDCSQIRGPAQGTRLLGLATAPGLAEVGVRASGPTEGAQTGFASTRTIVSRETSKAPGLVPKPSRWRPHSSDV
jgi:hypothetical protein